MGNVKDIGSIIFGVLAFCGVLYLSYWLCKNVSYWFFYEDMVTETVKELVKQAALK